MPSQHAQAIAYQTIYISLYISKHLKHGHRVFNPFFIFVAQCLLLIVAASRSVINHWLTNQPINSKASQLINFSLILMQSIFAASFLVTMHCWHDDWLCSLLFMVSSLSSSGLIINHKSQSQNNGWSLNYPILAGKQKSSVNNFLNQIYWFSFNYSKLSSSYN